MTVLVTLLVVLTLWIWAIFDCVTTPTQAVRNLPKLAWLATIFFLPWAGVLGWFWFGRPRKGVRVDPWQSLQTTPRAPRASSSGPIGPDDDPDFLSGL